MAAGTSSSKRKSSYTRKKKPTKNSSEVRKKSRSRKGNKSKKRHHDVSVPYSDEDSRTEDSLSFSSSDSEEYRHRRARSRTRANIKGSKKRVRRSSSSHKDRRESPRRKKRKGSKRNDGPERRKKINKRKRGNGYSRRDASVDSMSSASWSCSTCQGGSSSGKSEFERPRERYEGKEKGKRSLVKKRNGRDRDRHRSRSWSLCREFGNDSSYEGQEKMTSENYSRRLRSVLTVPKESEEEGRYQSKDDNKAEIIQAYDDCPSCRSNDSYDGGRKKESSHHMHIVSEKRRVDDGRVEEVCTSKIRTTQFTHSGKDDAIASRGENDPTRDVIGLTKVRDRSEDLVGVGNSKDNDLESLLRQKALENLRKFRGGLHTNMIAPGGEKGKIDNSVNQPSAAKTESIRIESHKEAGSGFAGAKKMVGKDVGYVVIPTLERSATSSQNNGEIPEGNYSQNESRAEVHAAHPVLGTGNLSSDQMAAYKATEESNMNPGAIKTKSSQGTTTFWQESSADHSILKKAVTSKDSPKGKLLGTRSVPDKIFAETPSTAPPGNDHTYGAEINKTCESAAPETSSCINPATGEHGSSEPRNGAEEDSQFKQKTMAVMRGGEMVQVTYKVYIPKKPPALARRQLQR